MALLRYAAKFDPFLSLDCAPHTLHPGAIQGKEGIKFCHLATLRPKRQTAHPPPPPPPLHSWTTSTSTTALAAVNKTKTAV